MADANTVRQARMRAYLAAYQAAHHAPTTIEYRAGFYFVAGTKRRNRFTAEEIDRMTRKLHQRVRVAA